MTDAEIKAELIISFTRAVVKFVPPEEQKFISYLSRRQHDLRQLLVSERDLTSVVLKYKMQTEQDSETGYYLSDPYYRELSQIVFKSIGIEIADQVDEPEIWAKFLEAFKDLSENIKFVIPDSYEQSEFDGVIEFISKREYKLRWKIRNLKIVIHPLRWTGKPQILKRLAQEFENKGFINHKNDFIRVFDKNEKIHWKGPVPYLAYLFSMITTDPYKWVGSKGKPPYTKSVENYFIQCDNSGIIARPVSITKTLHDVKERSKSHHTKLRRDIDNFIKIISTL